MLGADDWAQMEADWGEVRLDNETQIAIRRGNETLPYQSVRIARQGGGGIEQDSEAGQEARGRVVVMGAVSLDIAPGDRFNDDNGALYTVTFVRPNRRVMTVAEAEEVE